MLDHPGHVRMQKTAQAPANAIAVQVRRVHIAFLVGKFMMPAVHCYPRQHRTPSRHRSHDDEHATHGSAGRERAVGKQAVIADSQAETREHPHAEEQANLKPADRPMEHECQRNQRAEERQHIEQDEMPPLQPAKVPASDDPIVAHFLTGNDSGTTANPSVHSPDNPLRQACRSGRQIPNHR